MPTPSPTILITPGTTRPRVNVGTPDEPVEVPPFFHAQFDLDDGISVVLRVVNEGGRSRVADLQLVEGETGAGLAGIVLCGTPVKDLHARALRRIAMMSSVASNEVIAQTVDRAVRRRVTGARLREVADAYLAGGIERVKEVEVAGDRQAYRLVARARQAGLLPEQS